jgi:RNA polymerase sigma-70 factor (ECF subfamily)
MAFPQLDAPLEAAVLAGARGDARARAGAFRSLFGALREPVYRLCHHLTGRPADAEDALQEVFLSVHRGLPAFRGEAGLATWVFRVALREGLRVRARRRDGVPLDDGASAQAATGTEARLEARHEARRVLAALEHLSAGQRAVLALFAVEGLGHPEIAAILGVPEGTVWSRLFAARTRLREVLAGGGTR